MRVRCVHLNGGLLELSQSGLVLSLKGGNRDDGERVPERSQSSDNLEDAKSQSRLSHVLC